MSADIVTQEDFGFCKSAGIETPYDSDQNQLQRRHFPNSTSSNIFSSKLSSKDDASPENNIDHEDLFPSAGAETRKAGLKQCERRHFSEQSEESANQDDRVDSNETKTSESTEIKKDDAGMKVFSF